MIDWPITRESRHFIFLIPLKYDHASPIRKPSLSISKDRQKLSELVCERSQLLYSANWRLFVNQVEASKIFQMREQFQKARVVFFGRMKLRKGTCIVWERSCLDECRTDQLFTIGWNCVPRAYSSEFGDPPAQHLSSPVCLWQSAFDWYFNKALLSNTGWRVGFLSGWRMRIR